VVDSFRDTGNAIGEGAAVALNKDIQEKLDAIYGNDVSKAQQALLTIRIFAATTGSAGIAKAATGVGEAASVALTKKLDSILDDIAQKALLKSGGVLDNSGNAVLDMSKLSANQKSVMGDLFGAETVTRIVPDGTKLARIPGIGETGLDDLYRVNRPDVDFVVIEYKFLSDKAKSGSSALGKTGDGLQGSESWIMGSDRINKAVGNNIGIDVRRAVDNGRVETWVVRTLPNGSTEVEVLDSLGKAKVVDTSKIILPGRSLSGAIR
jgi:filamentous hemagglutinin